MSLHDPKRLRVLSTTEDPGTEDASRRRFLEIMGASLALSGLGACTRQPSESIVPYVRQPEEIVPGKPLFYATSMVHGGYATGVLVESHTGRPTKIEGNPQHQASLGATNAFMQASLLTLYDPDRSSVVAKLGQISTWERLVAELGDAAHKERARGGAGIRILTETVTSPSLGGQLRALLRDFPNARWHQHEACGRDHAKAGARLAFGAPLEARYDLTGADVVLSLDADFLAAGPGSLRYGREIAARRVPGGRPPMNRLYAIESTPTCTGMFADHHLAVRPSELVAFALEIAAELGVSGAERPAPPDPLRSKWAVAIARDLQARAGRSLVVAGEHAPPGVHLLAHAMNDALGNMGKTVVYTDPVEIEPVDQLASLRDLTAAMRAGEVGLLILLGGNPVYTAPADLDFAGALRQVGLRVHLALYDDETSEHCHWHVPEAHYLESWGDARAFDGAVSLVQPLIEPLYGGKSASELLAALRGDPSAKGIDLLRDHWRAELGVAGFEATWRKALHDGFIAGTAFPPTPARLQSDALRHAAAELAPTPVDPEGYELLFRPDPTIDDGRFANISWLQELPKPLTKLTWDNAALISPRTAERLGLTDDDVVELSCAGRTVKAPVLILPGQPDRTVTAHLGHGRTRAGKVGTGIGFNAFSLRTSASLGFERSLTIRKTGERYPLARTQHHFTMEGRAIARSIPLAELVAHPELLRGEAPHERLSLYPEHRYDGHAWGMSVDLGACTACNACVVACQAENNIPTVGKDQVLRGREMHWIRIDQYFQGSLDEPLVENEPMLCQHCELAPCEVVCPVAATTHSAEGLNEMTYNRCVGSRYCSNNCPYKVRRFNFLEYNADETQVTNLRHNPDVTVRSRGVMEKCTYCVQRISQGRIQAEREGRRVKDGEVVTACQQACPTGAIVFGDINDPSSRVRALKADPRTFAVLEELNTRPRTTYLAKIRNPNPALTGS